MDFSRTSDIVPPERVVFPVTIIGLGGIGSFLPVPLVKLGVKHFTLYDHDDVEPQNVPCQAYPTPTIGLKKVNVMAQIARQEGACVTSIPLKFARQTQVTEGVVISAVDSMSSRADIWNDVKKRAVFVPLFIDGRIGILWDDERRRVKAECIEIFTVNPSVPEDRELYEGHLFPDSAASPARCTAQEVVYVGYFTAAFIVSNIRKWVVGEPYPRHLIWNALTLETLQVAF